jgi:beta-glucosidase
MNKKNIFPFLDENLSIEERVNDLVNRMTLEEKISQMKYNAPAIEHLGIPEYNWWNECLHGVARAGLATQFPQALNLASTFDTDLIFQVAQAISDEARAKYNDFSKAGKTDIYQGLTFWSPNINIFRDPRWGRGHETYGEDPFLTGEMGYYFIKGLQGDDEKYLKLVATPKHFAVHSGPESDRHIFDARVSERDLRETYLPAFKKCIVEARAHSIMCAYNRLFGEPCCGSKKLRKILREEWKFEGYVVSDCWAVEDFYEHHKVCLNAEEAVALSVKMGTDLCCGNCYSKLLDAVKSNLITEEEINISVKRLFKARFLLGMFDNPDKVPYSKISYSVVNCQKHNDLSFEAALKSIVLLKNDGLLPLNDNYKKIAVIGPNANDIEVLLGNYNGTPSNPVTILEGIKKKVSNKAEVVYEQGCNLVSSLLHFEVIPKECFFTEDGNQGLVAEYFSEKDFEGKPLFTKIDESINFNWWNDSPDNRLNRLDFSVKWSGYIIPKYSGYYQFDLKEQDNLKFYFNNKLVIYKKEQLNNFTVKLEAGNKYKIIVEMPSYKRDNFIQLLWAYDNPNLLEDAIKLAKESDLIILSLGLSPIIEGEEMDVNLPGFYKGDRTNIELPDTQMNLMKVLYALKKPIVLVLLTGGAISLEWANENINAILLAGYPGQRGGDAVAEVLWGGFNPSGRLPITYYKSTNQLPPFKDYNMKGRTYRYLDDIPLYPFGFGLSYTKFLYSNLKLSKERIKPDEVLFVSIEVQNIGDLLGDEVVQLYIKDLKSNYEVPKISLKGFNKVHLLPSEKKIIEFKIKPEYLSLIDDENERVIEPGQFEIFVGGVQPGFNDLNPTSNYVSTIFEVVGDLFLID